jgi:hypothetical protein
MLHPAPSLHHDITRPYHTQLNQATGAMDSSSSVFGRNYFGNSSTTVPIASNPSIFGASREDHHTNGFSSATTSLFGSRPASRGLFGGTSSFGSPGAPGGAEGTCTTDGFGQSGSIFGSGLTHGTESSSAKVAKASTTSLRVADNQALEYVRFNTIQYDLLTVRTVLVQIS